ncbi:hypothetical protein [Lacimicrobium alkaliphilum]|uniref:HAD family hydrolase n=1 Tax=Lacimicrobium alkaliphilum TaxID=1526571 RepID=A0A0U2ZLP8_9ALTE|nr:hypothetical protein [Lacimicrobium alkaliphilum]ALS99244.1 hypothetical protein AT746_13920 [Lacimicrobium alkaliphilum]
MNKGVVLRDFGYNFLGPICSEYMASLVKYVREKETDKLVFLAREGYFFRKAYERLAGNGLIEPLPHIYLHASRTFLFRISIGDRLTWRWSLANKFSGTLRELLEGRFGFTSRQVEEIFSADELAVNWVLPYESEALQAHFSLHIDALKQSVQASRQVYLDYLQSLGLDSTKSLLMVDVGYAGTIQKLLTRLLETDTQGLYFIATRDGTQHIGGHQATMKGVYKTGVKMGDGYLMLDRSLFLESLLTSPDGQFVDISRASEFSASPFHFVFGRTAYPQQHFHELTQIFEGAIEAVVHNLQQGIGFSAAEIERHYDTYVTRRDMFPRATWPLFDVDDAISGNGNVNPMRLFGL